MSSNIKHLRLFRWALGLGILLVAATLGGIANAQDLSCGAGITPSVLTAPPRFVGDDIRVRLNVNVGAIQGGTVLAIPDVHFKLVCFDDGGFGACVPGADAGTVTFVGNITDTCAGTDFTGAAVANDLTFTPTATFNLAANSNCNIEFDLNVNALGTDATPALIQEAAAYDGTCDNALPGSASGSLAYTVDDCSVKVDKQVDCGDGQGFIDATLVKNNEDGTLSCDGINGEPVAVRYRAQNTGTVDLFSCVITESNSGIGAGPGSIGDILEGATTGFFNDANQVCSDELEAGEPDTAMISCFCTEAENPDIKTSASDTVDFECGEPGVSISKVCDPQEPDNGGTVNDIHVTVTNTGDVDLENCVVTDSIFLDDPLCPANIGSGTDIPVNDIMSLPAGGQAVMLETSIADLPDDACNTVSVVCDVVGSDQTVDADADDLCETPGEGCLTRTPGFWGTHPHITALFLPLENCGLTVNTTTAHTLVSATEEMCSVGKDSKTVGTSPQQIQLIRQCMAAKLNIAATDEGGGDCESESAGITATIEECCEELCPDDPKPSDINASLCIEELDAFNNLLDTLDSFGPFIMPGPADSSQCRASKNNGFVNTGAGRDYGPKK